MFHMLSKIGAPKQLENLKPWSSFPNASSLSGPSVWIDWSTWEPLSAASLRGGLASKVLERRVMSAFRHRVDWCSVISQRKMINSGSKRTTGCVGSRRLYTHRDVAKKCTAHPEYLTPSKGLMDWTISCKFRLGYMGSDCPIASWVISFGQKLWVRSHRSTLCFGYGNRVASCQHRNYGSRWVADDLELE